MSDDPFDDILNLEEEFYQEGYREGLADGDRAGRIEGRSLGLEKGFEKFLESGRLHARAVIWANRLPGLRAKSAARRSGKGSTERAGGMEGNREGHREGEGEENRIRRELPLLSANPRLEKHVTLMHALVEPDILSTENTDEAVDDFDDRVRRAQGKAKIIERMIGEDAGRRSQGG